MLYPCFSHVLTNGMLSLHILLYNLPHYYLCNWCLFLYYERVPYHKRVIDLCWCNSYDRVRLFTKSNIACSLCYLVFIVWCLSFAPHSVKSKWNSKWLQLKFYFYLSLDQLIQNSYCYYRQMGFCLFSALWVISLSITF